MVYSGRTAIRASTAIASDADKSNFATSRRPREQERPRDDAQAKDRRREYRVDVDPGKNGLSRRALPATGAPRWSSTAGAY